MSAQAPPVLPPEKAAENKGPQVLLTGWALTATATLFVAARMFSRFRKLGKISTGDYIVLLSLTLGYVYMSILTVAVDSGSGRHMATLTIPQAERALLLTTISFIPGIMSYIVPKFAVIILIKDLLSPSRKHMVAIWILAVVSAMLTAVCIIVVYAQCDPPRAFWTIGLSARCWDPVVLMATSITASASSALLDFWLALYPAAVLWGMSITLRKKVALSTALGCGVCAGTVAVYKCTTLKQAAVVSDFTYSGIDLVIWTSIEANCVIISACIPMLLPLMEVIFGEGFLNSGGQMRGLRSFRTYPKEAYGNLSDDGAVEMRAGATEGKGCPRQASV